MTIKASVVGVGKIGTKHATILKSMPNVELGPVVDIDAERAETVADQLDTTSSGIAEAIETSDCLFVCTPDDQHTDITVRAIKNGLHTFVEKPLADTTAETERLVNASKNSDQIHMVGHILRFDPRYQGIRTAVKDNGLGDVVTVTMDRFVKRARARRTGAVSPPWMRLGVHDFDLVEWLFGTDVTELSAIESAGRLPEEGYELDETVSVLAALSCGGTATFNMGFCLPEGHHGSIVRTVAAGTDGTVSIDASGTEAIVATQDPERTIDTHLWPTIAGTPDGALARQDRAFIRSIRDGHRSPIPFSAGHRSVQIAEAVETAVNKQSRVTLPSK